MRFAPTRSASSISACSRLAELRSARRKLADFICAYCRSLPRKIASRRSGRVQDRAEQFRAAQLNALQERSADVHADQRNSILIQFLKRFDPASTAAFALRRIDYLPRLIMLLFEAIAGFRIVEDHCEQHGKDPQIFQDFEKRPVAEEIGGPLEAKLDRVQRHGPAMADASPVISPEKRSFSCFAQRHRFSTVSLFGYFAVDFDGAVGSDERFIKFGIVFQAPHRVSQQAGRANQGIALPIEPCRGRPIRNVHGLR